MLPEKTQTTVIEQKIFLRGYQKFEIRADGDMEVTFKRFSTHNQFKFPLWHLDPSPTRLKHVELGALTGTYVFGILSVLIVISMCVARDSSIAFGLAFPLVMFLILLWACYWKLKVQSINAQVYHYRNGAGQIHIWYNNPNQAQFESFCEMLTKRAEEAWNHRPIDPDRSSLAGELAALKKLNDSGVLTDAEFDRAKTKLLEQQEQRRIGFS